mgnify:CR=1 FL=1
MRTIEIKACKPFRSEDVVNYCVTAVMFNASRKGEAIDRFGVFAPGIIKEKNKESYCVRRRRTHTNLVVARGLNPDAIFR